MMYCIHENEVRPVRISSNGNLVDAQYSMQLIGREHDKQNWPIQFKSAALAGMALEARQSKCAHNWQYISHEEAKCQKCGAIKLVADI